MQTPLLTMSGISKSFGAVKALKNVDLHLNKGEVHALMGENGAGKSTLMKVLIGVIEADEGSIQYKGTPINFTSILDAQKHGVSMIFQELNLVPHLSVAENIFFSREPTKYGVIQKNEMEHKAGELLNLFDIDVNPSDIVKDLSVAQQQMVEIAKALSFDLEVLIMDEPTSSLTEKEIEHLFNVVEKLRSQGVAIVYISHRMNELKRICDHITIFRDGCYISDHKFHEIKMDEIISKMVGRSLDNHFPARSCIPESEILMSVKSLYREGEFNPISFDLFKGEILGITGLIGAKRTELARVIFGADAFTSGSIVVHQKEVNINSPFDAIKAGIAYLSEDRKLNAVAVKMSIRENVTMASMDKVSNHAGYINLTTEKLASEKYIQRMEIKTPTVEQLVLNLSGGNQQKVVIGKWLFRDAKIMIFDEPTRGIDVGAKFAIYELLDELAAQGVGIIMISSELPEVLGMSDRIMIMKEGEMTAILDAKHTDQEQIMQYATGVKHMFKKDNLEAA